MLGYVLRILDRQLYYNIETYVMWMIKCFLILLFPNCYILLYTVILISGWRDQTIDTSPWILPWTKRSGSSRRIFVMQSCSSKSQIPVMSWNLFMVWLLRNFTFLKMISSFVIFLLLIINVIEVQKLTLNHLSDNHLSDVVYITLNV